MPMNPNIFEGAELAPDMELADKEFRASVQRLHRAAAHDGILAGRELESDAELLRKYGDGLNRKDKIAFGWIDPELSPKISADGTRLADLDTPVSRALATILKQLADPEFVYLASLTDRWRLVHETGRTPGPPTTSHIEKLATTDSIREVIESAPVEPIRGHYPSLACRAFGAKWKLNLTSDGRLVVTYLDCGTCESCLRWRQLLNVRRFQHVATGTATVVEVPGHLTIDAARATATRLSRFGSGARATTLQRDNDYEWTVFVVWALPVDHDPIADAMGRWEMVGSIVDRPVSPAEFEGRCPLAKTEDSVAETRPDGKPKQRRLVLFHQWADYAEPECNYRLDDGTVEDTPIEKMDGESTPLTPEETRRSKLPIEHQQYLYMREWLPVGSSINRGTWNDFVDSVDAGDSGRVWALLTDGGMAYRGPTRALRDVANWLIRGALYQEWLEGYRPVLDAVGIVSPSPTC